MNDNLSGFISSRKEHLISMINRIEKELKYAPPGSLNIAHCRNTTQYYMYKGRNEKPEYISVSNTELIQRLAQKDYHKLVLICARRELSYLNRLDADYPGTRPEDAYDTLSKERQDLVVPIVQSNEEYAKEWENEEYCGNSYHPEYKRYKTSKGEMVRSKSECIIADHLFKKGIPYRYEAPLWLESKGTTVYPDFTVLNVRTREVFYHEHFGMMSDPRYSTDAIAKIQNYQRSGFFLGETLIASYETNEDTLDLDILDQTIDRYYL